MNLGGAMANNFIKTKLSINTDNESTMSSLQQDLMKEELEQVEKKHPMEKNQVCIDGTYMVEYDKHVELGFFIRNTLPNKINFENLPLVITDSKGEVILKKVFNMIDFGTLQPMCARPWKIELKKKYLLKPIKQDDWKIVFDASETGTKAVNTLDLELKNVPKNLTYKEKKDLMNFYNTLPRLRKGSFEINMYKLGYNSSKDVYITLIFRNGTDKTGGIEKLPINVMSKIGTPLLRTVFEPKEPMKIPAKSAILQTFTFKVDGSLVDSIPEKDLIVKFE
ncbi:SLAP domain-containing protein [Clostridium sp. MSJ-4]|uniref:SLAP domain-containing protein n=1 Tax=Clostridium simiarum TaxID=2841506 RepID=A0ABS6F1U9_9CLOT|nr:SLAP domain-containing protein [Clostridium simiarum]MBU5592497.1 SLAP domain-containing protein [Clostridium simiarum]